MLNKFFSINLNFDSLGEAYGWPNDLYEDKAFTSGIERILKISDKYNLPITFFLVGKDLENKKNFEIIRKLSDNDNIEIANHSYNHLFNFGSRNEETIYNEIYKSHEIIYKCTGQESKGFISPTWSISNNVIKSLIKLNYDYDTSYFQSIFIYPAVLKIFFSHLIKGKFSKSLNILNRRDYLIPFNRRSKPFFLNSRMQIVPNKSEESILEFPMPTINQFYPPIWHTLGYMFGWKFLKKNLSKILSTENPFFYLIHPADFLDNQDLDPRFNLALERMDKINHQTKIKNLETVLELIISNGYKGMKLIDLAKRYNERKS